MNKTESLDYAINRFGFWSVIDLKWLGLSLILLCLSGLSLAKTPQALIAEIDMEALGEALAPETVTQLLDGAGKKYSDGDRRALAVLISLGAINTNDLRTKDLTTILERAERTLSHPAFQGAVGELGLIDRLDEPWSHEHLLLESPFLKLLHQALGAGTLTGYDLRAKGIYDNFPQGLTFIYSHSSKSHLQQLVGLMSAHNIAADIYVTPKVSAFLHREGWGGVGSDPDSLANGVQIVNGRESATLFEFNSAEDKANFHKLVRRYAKRDTEDEPGLIQDAWWQPFYYSDQPFGDFPSISLVILASDQMEATLTVVADKTDRVVQALSGQGFSVRVDKVWVNPAFHRFLLGDFR